MRGRTRGSATYRSWWMLLLVVVAVSLAAPAAAHHRPNHAGGGGGSGGGGGGGGGGTVTVTCGQVLTTSTRVGNDLAGCESDGLVVGASRITVDLNGHTIEGSGSGAGVRNHGHTGVTIANGTVEDFEHGVLLVDGAASNVVEGITAKFNKTGLSLEGAGENRLQSNTITDNGNDGISLDASSANTLLSNYVSGNGDAGVAIVSGSNANRAESNVSLENGDAGFEVVASEGSRLIGNTVHGHQDSGVVLQDAHDGLVRGNDLRFNAEAMELQASTGNRVESNDASNSSGRGIEVEDGSLGNELVGNIASGNGSQGIYLGDEAGPGEGNLLDNNTASANSGNGIHVAKGGHTISRNIARDNSGWGIYAAPGNIDGGRNRASGNSEPEQCFGVVCAR